MHVVHSVCGGGLSTNVRGLMMIFYSNIISYSVSAAVLAGCKVCLLEIYNVRQGERESAGRDVDPLFAARPLAHCQKFENPCYPHLTLSLSHKAQKCDLSLLQKTLHMALFSYRKVLDRRRKKR